MYDAFTYKLSEENCHNTQNVGNDLSLDQVITTFALNGDSFYSDCIVESTDQVSYFKSGTPKYAICDGGAVDAGVFDHDIRWQITGILGDAASVDIDDFQPSWVADFTDTARERLDTTHWTVEIADDIQRANDQTDNRLRDIFDIFGFDYGHWENGQFYYKFENYVLQLTPWTTNGVEMTTPANGSNDPYEIGIDSDSWWDNITQGGDNDITDEVHALSEYVETLEGDYELVDILQAVAKCQEIQENDGFMLKLVESASETDLPTVEHTIIDLLLNHGNEVRETIEQLAYTVGNK